MTGGRATAQQLDDLAAESYQFRGGLFSLLLSTVAHDSKKHELIMRFIERRLAAATDVPIPRPPSSWIRGLPAPR